MVRGIFTTNCGLLPIRACFLKDEACRRWRAGSDLRDVVTDLGCGGNDADCSMLRSAIRAGVGCVVVGAAGKSQTEHTGKCRSLENAGI